MYKTLIWCASVAACLAALVVIVAVASASTEHSGVTNMQPQLAAAVAAPTEMPVQPEVIPHEDDLKVGQLEDYVLEAMNSAAKPDEFSASYEDIAHDIAVVVSDPKEPPIWKEDTDRGRTATILVSIGLWETRFRAYVDEGKCNDKAWRASAEGQNLMRMGRCDGGIARSIWQIHADWGGIVVLPVNYDSDDGNKREWCYANEYSDDDGIVVKPADFLDRQLAARVALHMARASIRKGAGLCQFTGEYGPGGCPKGDTRLLWAEKYSSQHPFNQH
jgi:hypothetical protein